MTTLQIIAIADVNAEPKFKGLPMPACGTCSCYQNLGFNIQMAFQPIVDIQAEKVYAYEALVRGEQGQGAGEVLAQITSDNMYSFDQTCRMTAIEQAAALALKSKTEH